MHLIKKALVAASIATTALVVPAAPPAVASGCPGSVSFVSGTPTSGYGGTITATFDTYGPGFSSECDLGWIESCALEVDGIPVVPVSCTTSYSSQPTVCPSTGLCQVYVQAPAWVFSPGSVHTVRAALQMKWGCCGFIGGPAEYEIGVWYVDSRVDVLPDCTSDLCKKVRPIVKVLLDRP